MSFEDSPRTFAFAPALIAQLPALLESYGANSPDGIHTLLCHWDDDGHTRKRAGSLALGTVELSRLEDGRLVVSGLWSTAIVAAWQAGAITEPIEQL